MLSYKMSDLHFLSNAVPITFLETYTWKRKEEMVMMTIEKMDPNGRKKPKGESMTELMSVGYLGVSGAFTILTKYYYPLYRKK